QSEIDGRNAADRRRRTGRSFEDDGVQGHDVQRRPESRVSVRIHERFMDFEMRSHVGVRLPDVELHGSARLRDLYGSAARPLRCTRAGSGFHIRLTGAGASYAAEPGIEDALAASSKLCE